jgi:hypothetical protein
MRNIVLVLSLMMLVAVGFAQIPGQGVPGAASGLKVTKVGFSDGAPMEGDEITIYAQLRNDGTRPIVNTTVSFLLDQAREIGNVSGITMGPGETRNLSITWMAEKWEHNMTAVLVMGGVPLMDTAASALVDVRAEPIGDTPSLLLALGVIALVIFGSVAAPSLIYRMRTTRR